MKHLLDCHKPEKTTRHGFIKGLLAMRGIKSREISDSLGITQSCLSHVLLGQVVSRRVQQAVADALGMSFDELWSTKP
jgi:lambda repressor-like predicted transcriptional regulator